MAEASRPQAPRIWVVDDDRAVRFVLATALRDAGFADAVYAPGNDSLARHLGQHVIVARVPGEAAAELAAAASAPGRATGVPGVVAETDAANPLRDQLQSALPGERMELLRDWGYTVN